MNRIRNMKVFREEIRKEITALMEIGFRSYGWSLTDPVVVMMPDLIYNSFKFRFILNNE